MAPPALAGWPHLRFLHSYPAMPVNAAFHGSSAVARQMPPPGTLPHTGTDFSWIFHTSLLSLPEAIASLPHPDLHPKVALSSDSVSVLPHPAISLLPYSA